jgi:predicted ATPase/DNA-binding SARP family transcriptional activator
MPWLPSLCCSCAMAGRSARGNLPAASHRAHDSLRINNVVAAVRLSLALLGTFDVRYDGRQLSDFRSQSVRALLAYLALEANRPHEREHLCALLWPSEPLPSALTNLRQALHRLRQSIEPSGSEGRHLLITRQSVQLNPATLELDVARFQEALSSVASHRHRSAAGCNYCMAQMRAALCQARGALLAGFSYAESEPFEEWLTAERERLSDQWARLLAELASAHERRGEFEQAVAILRRWTLLEPWNEQAHLRLIAALAWNGQRSAALRQFKRFSTFLAAEFGVEPAQPMAALAQQVRAGGPPPPPGYRVLHAPAQLTTLVGRGPELARLNGLLSDPTCRLLTLTGPGGSGKTHLAVEAARKSCHAFADGTLFVSLADLRHARQLPEALAAALGLPVTPKQPLLDQVGEELQARELLLVLDTCEHVQALGAMVTHLLAAAPRLTVLATSRAALNLRSEWVRPVGGLGLVGPGCNSPEPTSYPAGQLFVQIARQVRPDFIPGPTEAAQILECCARLNGMPLGIVLAASRLRTHDLVEIAGGMRANVDMLTTTMHDLIPRHRSLRTVFEWSWQLLDPTEQRTLACMSVFSGGCDRTAAQAVCGTDTPVDELVTKSLLHRNAEGRYGMDDITRQLAEEHLEVSGEVDARRALHSAYYLGLAASLAAQIHGPQGCADAVAMEAELGNLCQAWEWAERVGDYQLLTPAAPVIRHLFATSHGLHPGSS